MDKTKQEEWRIYLQNRTATLWAGYTRIWPNLGVVPAIKINMRLSATAGQNRYDQNVVEMAGKFLNRSKEFGQEMVNVILPHELAHQIDYNLNGVPDGNKWHGNQWKVIMVKIGQNPARCHRMDLKTGIISE